MGAIFIAKGPIIKKEKIGNVLEPFENVQLYNLLTSTLNITGHNNNGTRNFFNLN